jgi:hypothetical protein
MGIGYPLAITTAWVQHLGKHALVQRLLREKASGRIILSRHQVHAATKNQIIIHRSSLQDDRTARSEGISIAYFT